MIVVIHTGCRNINAQSNPETRIIRDGQLDSFFGVASGTSQISGPPPQVEVVSLNET